MGHTPTHPPAPHILFPAPIFLPCLPFNPRPTSAPLGSPAPFSGIWRIPTQSFPSEQSQDKQEKEGEEPPIHSCQDFQAEAEPHFPRKEQGFAFVSGGVCWQGEMIYYLNFGMHGWALNSLQSPRTGGKNLPGSGKRVQTRAQLVTKGKMLGTRDTNMQSVESHIEGLGANSLSRASRNKEPEVKIKPRSLGGLRRLKYGQVCVDWRQGRAQSMSLELLGLWEIPRCSQAPPGSWDGPGGDGHPILGCFTSWTI